jgi:hypothetical protein
VDGLVRARRRQEARIRREGDAADPAVVVAQDRGILGAGEGGVEDEEKQRCVAHEDSGVKIEEP